MEWQLRAGDLFIFKKLTIKIDTYVIKTNLAHGHLDNDLQIP
jgi:hypothetical protein